MSRRRELPSFLQPWDTLLRYVKLVESRNALHFELALRAPVDSASQPSGNIPCSRRELQRTPSEISSIMVRPCPDDAVTVTQPVYRAVLQSSADWFLVRLGGILSILSMFFISEPQKELKSHWL
jgi:hypothetical protein